MPDTNAMVCEPSEPSFVVKLCADFVARVEMYLLEFDGVREPNHHDVRIQAQAQASLESLLCMCA